MPTVDILPRALLSVSPTTEEVLAEVALDSPDQLAAKLERAQRAFERWRLTETEDRAAVLRAVAERLESDVSRWATLITTEMGKPIAEAEAEVRKSALNCRFYADQGPRLLQDSLVDVSPHSARIRYAPLGLILAVMPWNFPFWQVMRVAAPVVMAGNGVLLRHASNVPQCALALESIFEDSGAHAGLFTTLLIETDRVRSVLADIRVQGLSLTGSTAAGSAVAAEAASLIKKQVLELGGSDPFVVLRDADLDITVQGAVASRLQNAGQSCIAAKRFIAEEEIADAFVEAFAGRIRSLQIGDPLKRQTQLGPLARRDLRDAAVDQVRRSIAAGAEPVIPGGARPGRGFFYEPTLLDQVPTEAPAFSEETFGPVATVTRVPNERAAVRLANATPFGLGASVWTRDRDRGMDVARQIQAGSVFVNAIVASDPRLPFGGTKASGYGRELAEWGIREFTNVQTIVVGAPSGP